MRLCAGESAGAPRGGRAELFVLLALEEVLALGGGGDQVFECAAVGQAIHQRSLQRRVVLQVADEPGTIGKLTTLLGRERINLRNLGILEPTPGGPGSLRMSFANEEDMNRAKAFLEREGYTVLL